MSSMRYVTTICFLGCLLSGCSAATWQGVAAGMAAAADGAQAPASDQTKLMLFGGQSHQTYLGCLSCNQYASDSVFNAYGTHGSAYSVPSVLNKYGEYGSRYSIYGACNPYATDPPVIVDGAGRFYGRLTLNQYSPQRTHDPKILAWLAAICE